MVSVQDHYSLRLARGVSDRVDLRARYEYVDVSGVSVVGAGPSSASSKIGSPYTLPWGSLSVATSTRTRPGKSNPRSSLPSGSARNAEVTASAKALLWFDRDNDDLFGGNLGLGISSDLDRWALRPEIGFLKNPGGEGTWWQWSLGVTIFSR